MGSVTVGTGSNFSVTGVSGTGSVGTVTIPFVDGVVATGNIGTVLIWGQVQTAQTPNWKEIKEAA